MPSTVNNRLFHEALCFVVIRGSPSNGSPSYLMPGGGFGQLQKGGLGGNGGGGRLANAGGGFGAKPVGVGAAAGGGFGQAAFKSGAKKWRRQGPVHTVHDKKDPAQHFWELRKFYGMPPAPWATKAEAHAQAGRAAALQLSGFSTGTPFNATFIVSSEEPERAGRPHYVSLDGRVHLTFGKDQNECWRVEVTGSDASARQAWVDGAGAVPVGSSQWQCRGGFGQENPTEMVTVSELQEVSTAERAAAVEAEALWLKDPAEASKQQREAAECKKRVSGVSALLAGCASADGSSVVLGAGGKVRALDGAQMGEVFRLLKRDYPACTALSFAGVSLAPAAGEELASCLADPAVGIRTVALATDLELKFDAECASLDASGRKLGPGEVAVLACWLRSPEVASSIVHLDVSKNPIGNPTSVAAKAGAVTTAKAAVGAWAELGGRWGEITQVHPIAGVKLNWVDDGSTSFTKAASLGSVVAGKDDLARQLAEAEAANDSSLEPQGLDGVPVDQIHSGSDTDSDADGDFTMNPVNEVLVVMSLE